MNTSNYRRILLVYPEFFPTYWGIQYALSLVGQKALMPPLGLITIAAMTPPEYEFRLVDLNCEKLTDQDLAWADMVLLSAMLPQRTALFNVADRCRKAGKLVVIGGPYPTACPDECQPHADVLVLNEGEITWPLFLKDLKAGHVQPRYTDAEKPDVTLTPCPRFDLLKVDYYSIIPIQFSRGCPFQCEFCDIIVMYGRKPRTKTPAQLCRELDALYATGFRGSVFIVDDNFIGNKLKVQELLPELRAWNEAHGHPFWYGTEASVNLADDFALMKEMVTADFIWVFLGLETPSEAGLKETRKFQNVPGSLEERVRLIQTSGLVVYGGFIIGFDSDTPDIFDRQIEFIEKAAIPNAMIGPLVALPGTPLFDRLKKEGRLVEADQDQDRTPASGYSNIQTVLPRRVLLQGHRKIVLSIYDPRHYFDRTLEAFRRLPRKASLADRWKQFLWLASLVFKRTAQPGQKKSLTTTWQFFKKLSAQLPADYKKEAKRFFARVLWYCPEQLPRCLGYTITGYHYYRFTRENMVPELDRAIDSLPPDSPKQTAA